MDDRSEGTGMTEARAGTGPDEGTYQDRLRRAYTQTEEAYHSAYPDTQYPSTVGFLRGFSSRTWKGYTVAVCLGILAALALWLLFGSTIHVG